MKPLPELTQKEENSELKKIPLHTHSLHKLASHKQLESFHYYVSDSGRLRKLNSNHNAVLQTCPVQYGGHLPHVASEHLKRDESKLRCREMYRLGVKDLVQKQRKTSH